MKKNGFTLIELLAVIVIIAVVALIAVPITYSYIEESKNQGLKTTCESIIRATERYVIDENKTTSTSISLSTLYDKKYIDKVPTEFSDGKVDVTVRDGSYSYQVLDKNGNKILDSNGSEVGACAQ